MEATEELPADGSGSPPTGSPPPVLGRYRLGARLGSGGFGTVYAAVDERLDRDVAVKVIPIGAPAPERASREALAAARLDHPGIVAVFDAGEDGEARYLVSELVRGRTLDALASAGELSDRDVLRVGLALADALEHAHGRGVIHRDVKPQNVIVPDRPRSARSAAKLTDFGVAHLAGDAPLTRTGDVVGTLAYMAPEQADGHRVDERADLYSLALVLYEGLAGVNPVRAGSPAATARRLGTVLPPLGRKRKDLPPELCAALDRALSPRPEDRGSLDELADELAAGLTGVSDEGGTILAHPLERPRTAELPPVAGRIAAGAGRRRPRGGGRHARARRAGHAARRGGSGRGGDRRAAAGRLARLHGRDRLPARARPAGRRARRAGRRRAPRRRSCAAPAAPGRCPRPRRCSAWPRSPAPTRPWRGAPRAGGSARASARPDCGGCCWRSRCSTRRCSPARTRRAGGRPTRAARSTACCGRRWPPG